MRKITWVFLGILTLSAASSLPAAAINKSQWAAQHSSQRAPAIFRAVVTTSATYVQFVLDDNGRFTIGTTAGDPTRSGDDNQKLIFGHPSPSTSDTMVQVDGNDYSIHSGVSSNAASITDGLSVTLDTASVRIEERLTVVTSPITGNPDTVRIYFKVTNTDSVSHDVALRTQLDTQLGDNDGAPFRIPNVGEVTHDREFTPAGSVPPQALVLDDLVAPNIVALFSFQPSGYLPPDRVVLGYWPNAVGQYDYTVNPANNFLDNDNDGVITGSSPDSDSSVIVYWGYPTAITLAAGASREFAIDYGMGNCTSASGNPFNILLCGPAQLSGQVSGATYEYTPVTVTAFLTNGSGAAVSGGQATLNLTPDLEVSPGYQITRPVETTLGGGIVAAGESAQIDWQITSNGRYLGLRQYSLTVNAGRKSNALRSITTATIPNVLYGVATDSNGNPVSGATITVFQGSAIVGTALTQSDGKYVVQGLSPGEYTVRLSVAGRPDSYFQAFVSDSSSGGRTGNPSAFEASAALTTYAYPNPVREGNSRIAFYTESAEAAEVQIFTTAGQLITTLTLATTGAGWHTVDWPINQVANGVYFYQVKVGDNYARGKIAVLKRRGL
jgi:hypothetical protein